MRRLINLAAVGPAAVTFGCAAPLDILYDDPPPWASWFGLIVIFFLIWYAWKGRHDAAETVEKFEVARKLKELRDLQFDDESPRPAQISIQEEIDRLEDRLLEL